MVGLFFIGCPSERCQSALLVKSKHQPSSKELKKIPLKGEDFFWACFLLSLGA
jgi:hypothetical protein